MTTANTDDIIFTGANYLKLTSVPEWSTYHQRYYAGAYRWIKSKQKFSSNALLHNFEHYEIVPAPGMGRAVFND